MTQTELITKRLDGKIAVITGGNSGIGLTTAFSTGTHSGTVVVALPRAQRRGFDTLQGAGVVI